MWKTNDEIFEKSETINTSITINPEMFGNHDSFD